MAITSFQGDHRWLSNFYPSPLTYHGQKFRDVETPYQWSKISSESGRLAIFRSSSPGQAKHLGKKYPRRDDWSLVKVSIMSKLLQLKFELPGLRRQLLDTGTQELVEGNTWGDTFWGVCGGVGENMLGKLLMQLRADLLNERIKT